MAAGTSTTLIRNGTVVTCIGNDRIPSHFKADVLVRDGAIVEVARDKRLSPREGWTIVDATDKLVCPGFVDTHRHVWESAYRFMGDWTLLEYVAKCLQVLFPVIEADDAYASQMLGYLEALNGGVTTVVDHCHLTREPQLFDAMLDATRKSGIRSFLCYARWEKWPNGTGRKEWQMNQLRRLVKEGTGSDRVTLGLAIDGLGEVFYRELQDELFPFAKESGIDVFSTHTVSKLSGIGPDTISQLAERGMLTQPILFVHCNEMSEEERDKLIAAECGISSTPEIELHMPLGNPVALTADEAGARVGLGVDCSSVVSGEMFSVMRSALQYQRGVENDKLHSQGKLPKYLKRKAGDVFRMATMGGARAIHREHLIGSVEVGKKADLVLINTLTPAMLGAERDPVQAIVMHASVSDVEMVLVDGEVVVDKTRPVSEGAFTRVKWTEEVKRVRESSERMKARISDWNTAEEAGYTRIRDIIGLTDEVCVEKY